MSFSWPNIYKELLKKSTERVNWVGKNRQITLNQLQKKTHKWLINPQKMLNFTHNKMNTKHQRQTRFRVSAAKRLQCHEAVGSMGKPASLRRGRWYSLSLWGGHFGNTDPNPTWIPLLSNISHGVLQRNEPVEIHGKRFTRGDWLTPFCRLRRSTVHHLRTGAQESWWRSSCPSPDPGEPVSEVLLWA